MSEICPDYGIAGDDGSGSDEEYSDDDDVNWKVGRAAAKCIEAIIISRHEMIEQFWSTISHVLIFQQLCNADLSSRSRKEKKM